MKLTLNIFEKDDDPKAKRRPLSHLFGGRIRTSTVVLIVAFLAVWWVYDTYRPQPPPKPPAPQVVPPVVHCTPLKLNEVGAGLVPE